MLTAAVDSPNKHHTGTFQQKKVNKSVITLLQRVLPRPFDVLQPSFR